MDKDTETAVVIFRKWGKRNGGDVIALFPFVPSDYAGLYCSSYMHVGQHGGADYLGVLSVTTPATPSEYAGLKAELESIGYTLDVRRRCPSWRNR